MTYAKIEKPRSGPIFLLSTVHVTLKHSHTIHIINYYNRNLRSAFSKDRISASVLRDFALFVSDFAENNIYSVFFDAEHESGLRICNFEIPDELWRLKTVFLLQNRKNNGFLKR